MSDHVTQDLKNALFRDGCERRAFIASRIIGSAAAEDPE
jgi:hypothetical protein